MPSSVLVIAYSECNVSVFDEIMVVNGRRRQQSVEHSIENISLRG